MKRGVVIIVALAVLGVIGWASTFTVAENEYAIVARFGNPKDAVSAGLHFKWPTPIDTVVRVDKRVHALDPKAAEYLTADKKNVMVDSFMVWTVEDPLKYLVTVSSRLGAEARLADVMRSVVGDVLSSLPFSALVSPDGQGIGVSNVNHQITEEVAPRALADFGIKVLAVRIKRLNFPGQNKDYVFKRMEQDRMTTASGIRSEGGEQYDKIVAEVDLKGAKLIAEAARQAEELIGEAEAEATRIYNEAYEKDPELYRFLRDLELLERSMGNDTMIVLPIDHWLLDVFDGVETESAVTEEGK